MSPEDAAIRASLDPPDIGVAPGEARPSAEWPVLVDETQAPPRLADCHAESDAAAAFARELARRHGEEYLRLLLQLYAQEAASEGPERRAADWLRWAEREAWCPCCGAKREGG